MSDLSAADIAEGHRLNAALASAPWFPYVNDLIGGHCVMSVDKWPSETGPGGVVADFINAETAEAIAWMRNHLPALLDAAEKVADLEHRLGVTRRALETEKRLHGETCELAGDLRRRLEKLEVGR